MKSALQKITELIKILPQKDAVLADKFLKCRNFEGILELVQSDLYKERKSKSTEDPSDYELKLEELAYELSTYMSYIEVPDNSDKYDYY